MSIAGRCKLYGLFWWVAALILAARARPVFGPEGLWMEEALIALGAAVVVGWGKGTTVMRSAARKARSRIIRRGPTAPPWSVFSLGTIALIVFFMALGYAIRVAPYPEQYRIWVIGIVYPGVALALLIGSRPLLES